MSMAGYSGSPLAKKLGIKPGYTIRVENAPAHYFERFTDLPDNIVVTEDNRSHKDLVHFFTMESATLQKNIVFLRKEIYPAGMLWISWPKKSARILTDVTEDVIRKIALANGLVDVKVCAVDEIWSGLKLVIPLKDRKHQT